MSSVSHASSRYLVGIDLGTTHLVVAYADLSLGPKTAIEIFEIEQLIGPGTIAARPLLPSVRYHPAHGELSEADTRLPWSQPEDPAHPVLGEWARVLGAKSRGRLVTSAKSWLSHGAVDRTAAILPWGAPEEVIKVSPVEASASYLAHVCNAWNHRFPAHPLEKQEIIVTVPASFDEAARALTLEAARLAGLTDPHLVEEPQAACYDWLWRHRKSLHKDLAGVRLLLIVDVGGGTTDLTLIKVETAHGQPELTRIGVGNHLMLGGDNMDLTLAHVIEKRLAGADQRLSSAELSQLVEQCRTAKELLLADEGPALLSVTLLGSGARLIGAARSAELSRAEVDSIVLDGFFPRVALEDVPDRKRSGVVEFGLPYAADPAISKHLAAFLSQHRQAARDAVGPDEPPIPNAVLLNGGVFRSDVITRRILDQLGAWRGGDIKCLANDRPDRAVACGAVAYALARHGLAIRRIGGGSARSYFLLIESEDQSRHMAVCLLPRGCEEGHEQVLSTRTFALRLGQAVRFHLVSSTADTVYSPGDLVEIDDEHFAPLPPLAVAFGASHQESRTEVPVQLAAVLTEVGTIKIQCVSLDPDHRRWDVEFQLRQPLVAPTVIAEHGRHPRVSEACELIRQVFGKKSKDFDAKKVKGLRAELEKLLGKREDWDTTLLRELYAALLSGLPHRRRSADHERVWLNLTGYCLRPGFGFPLDDWRVEQVWSTYALGIQFVHETQNWNEWWTLWRRIAGGLNESAQRVLFTELADYIDPDKAKRGNLAVVAKKRGFEDMLRLAAVLERLPVQDKIRLGRWLLQRLVKPGEPAETAWALGRVGARIPFYGSAHTVVPRDIAEAWLNKLLPLDWKKLPHAAFAVTLIVRMSGDRERDIAPELRREILERLRAIKAPESWVGMVRTIQELQESDVRRVFGEVLPPGLRLLERPN